jgi:hypothetical protein
MKEWPAKKPLLNEKNKQTHLVFIKRHVRDSPNIWSFLAIKENAMSGANPTPLITLRTPQ